MPRWPPTARLRVDSSVFLSEENLESRLFGFSGRVDSLVFFWENFHRETPVLPKLIYYIPTIVIARLRAWLARPVGEHGFHLRKNNKSSSSWPLFPDIRSANTVVCSSAWPLWLSNESRQGLWGLFLLFSGFSIKSCVMAGQFRSVLSLSIVPISGFLCLLCVFHIGVI